MARFRTKTATTKTVNKAGGEAYTQEPKLELVSLLLTSFVSDKFYEQATDQLDRLASLAKSIKDKKFLAKAAIFARNEYGMRSITHALMGEVVHEVKGEEWTKNAVAKAIHRPDDMLETLAYYAGKYGKPIPNSLKKGFAIAVRKFDGYQIAKYRGERSDVKMVDLFNLIHPKPSSAKESKIWSDLLKGELKNTDTWEAKLSGVGQVAETEEEKTALKGQAWAELIRENKLGYFALLKNLRNIETQAPEVLPDALKMLQDEKLIRKSLVLPFRFSTAAEEVKDRRTLEAIGNALNISMANVPKFDGKTLIVLDGSGSMSGKPITIGSLFAAVIYKANPDAEFMVFSTNAKYHVFNPSDSVLSIAERMKAMATGGGTDFHTIFPAANKRYERIIILSDMQGWMGYSAPTKQLDAYEKQYSASPFLYSFDLNGYGTLQFPQPRVFAIAGFSEKVLDLFRALETDKNALLSRIDAVEL